MKKPSSVALTISTYWKGARIDAGAIEKVIDGIIAANPSQVEQVKEKPKTFGWFVGQAMKATQGKANPQAVNEILKKQLGID